VLGAGAGLLDAVVLGAWVLGKILFFLPNEYALHSKKLVPNLKFFKLV